MLSYVEFLVELHLVDTDFVRLLYEIYLEIDKGG